MKSIKSAVFFSVFLCISQFPFNASAQLFGSDEENWKRLFHELKKINSRLVKLENDEILNLRYQLEDLLRQIEEMKQILPQLQGAVELNKSETNSKVKKLDAKLSDLQAEIKHQVLHKITQQGKTLDNVNEKQKKLKEGLAQDMEQFQRVNKESFNNFASINKSMLETIVQRLVSLDETTKKNFEDMKGLFISDVIPAMAKENQENRTVILQHLSASRETSDKTLENLSVKNQKLIDILEENLIQGAETKNQVEAINKNIDSVDKSVKVINKSVTTVNNNLVVMDKNITVNNKNLMVADEKMNKLAETLKALQTQHSASNENLATLNDSLGKIQALDQLADEKINKLIENSTTMVTHANQLETSILSQLKQSSQKEDSNQDKIDLANEKLARLIEILKAIANEQDKMGKFVEAQSGLKKVQEGLVKNQEGIKEALADLRKKTNVSISRNDDIKKAITDLRKKANVNISRNNDIKKILGKMKKNKSSVSKKSSKN